MSNDSQIERRARGGEGKFAKSSPARFTLTAGDIRELYETARALAAMGGAPFLNRLFDAEAALSTGHLDRVQQILARTRDEFEKSHFRLLRFHSEESSDRRKARDDARLGAKKQQVEDVLKRFDVLLAVSERMARAAAKIALDESGAADAAEPPRDNRVDSADLPAGFAEAFRAEQATDGQFATVSRFFSCAAVSSAAQIAPSSLYFLRTKTTGYVLQTSSDPIQGLVRLKNVLTGQEVKPQPVEALLEQGRKDKFYVLTGRMDEEPARAEARGEAPDDSAADPSDPLEAQNELLDRQLFNVLMMAVKNSGLNISTDVIIQVRDNEFRKGLYHDAFEKLNQLAVRFEAAAVRRKEELRQHDQWLNSGQSGLSMREVEEAKLRNANERTRLEHAVHRFGLVVEPLRILAS